MHGHEALIDQVQETLVGFVEVFGPDAGVVLFPREARLVGPSRVEGRHVGVQPGDDLDHVEAFGLPIGGKLLKLRGPMEPLAEPHPPGIGQPEKRRAVQVLEMPAGRRRREGPWR